MEHLQDWRTEVARNYHLREPSPRTGFGASNNTNTGFGTTNTSGGGLFGGGSTGFGSSGGTSNK
jgi:hypothetical protein